MPRQREAAILQLAASEDDGIEEGDSDEHGSGEDGENQEEHSSEVSGQEDSEYEAPQDKKAKGK